MNGGNILKFITSSKIEAAPPGNTVQLLKPGGSISFGKIQTYVWVQGVENVKACILEPNVSPWLHRIRIV